MRPFFGFCLNLTYPTLSCFIRPHQPLKMPCSTGKISMQCIVRTYFYRNHKGDRHYLVIFHCMQQLNIRDLEQRLKQGKLSFASPERMNRFLGISPGSVSPFGLIHDKDHHVYVFIDKKLLNAERLSFHPNDNTASLSLSLMDFIRFLDQMGNGYEFLELYD